MSVAAAIKGRDAVFELGCLPLSCGKELANARLAYRVFGELNAERSNLVLFPSSYGAWPEDIDWVVGPILDPLRWCVLLVSQFGNGRSSSPSNAAMGVAEQGWVIHHADNVAAQKRLIQEVFGVERLALIYGWSMGAQQAYHWAALEPQAVERICCLCGTARTTPTTACSCSACARPSPAIPPGMGNSSGPPRAGAAQLRPDLRQLGRQPGLLPAGSARGTGLHQRGRLRGAQLVACLPPP